MTSDARLPVAILTGFLGSGKTTLLGALLRHADFARTAVIINEFGAVALDHDLIEASDESFITLKTGCLCCAVRGDLVRTLEDLLRRREAGTIVAFERVVIETSGLADPAPVLHALMGDDALCEHVRLAAVTTTVDAINGMATLDHYPEAMKQVAVADHIVITKTDLADTHDEIKARLSAINPTADLAIASFGAVAPESLFHAPLFEVTSRLDALNNANQLPAHTDGIAFHAITRDKPIAALALTLFLEALVETIGSDLLRLKGLVAIAETPEAPAVIHGVQHLLHPPVWLTRWPTANQTTRIVFITRNVPGLWIDALLAAIEAEVAEMAQSTKAT
jgi:G3E family GTPase